MSCPDAQGRSRFRRLGIVTTFSLPDGRTLAAEPMSDGYWNLRIEGEPHADIVGQPLNSTLADLVGYNVAHEEWPAWVDDLAREIQAEFETHT
ncbi:MAG: hypothetical protein K0R20_590 [Actinomycetia bacterium]|nr:hypothetical protein [Actinomycetes bacterium]